MTTEDEDFLGFCELLAIAGDEIGPDRAKQLIARVRSLQDQIAATQALANACARHAGIADAERDILQAKLDAITGPALWEAMQTTVYSAPSTYGFQLATTNVYQLTAAIDALKRAKQRSATEGQGHG